MAKTGVSFELTVRSLLVHVLVQSGAGPSKRIKKAWVSSRSEVYETACHCVNLKQRSFSSAERFIDRSLQIRIRPIGWFVTKLIHK
jgi:hypothetical protein